MIYRLDETNGTKSWVNIGGSGSGSGAGVSGIFTQTADNKAYYRDGNIGVGTANPTKPFTIDGELLVKTNSIKQISVGYQYGLLLTTEGKLYEFGKKNESRLFGTSIDIINIRSQIDLSKNKIKYIESHATDSALVVTEEGKVYGWGKNTYGHLGLNNTTDQTIPQLITTTIGTLTINKVTQGRNHSLFLDSDGKIYSCGRNASGELGLGNTDNKTTPQHITFLNNIRITDIVAGYSTSLALTNKGKVYAWGYNANGELGLGDSGNYVNRMNPELIEGLDKFFIKQISTDGSDPSGNTVHSLALTTDGKVCLGM